jgi:asparagine synthase (glutamine-hydrolysing)
MCGIVGVLNFDGALVNPSALMRMRDAVHHRGPDDAGIWTDGNVGLAHRRLSIFDLSPLGHQPMVSADGTLVLVFNGEIFNFIELRADLQSRGHTFTSGSDTEVLLRLWQEQGPACLSQLVGMFAFAVWDTSRRTLFAARDRAGIKPFVYTVAGRTLMFSSEAKSILAAPGFSARLDPLGFANFQFAGYPLGGRTLFEGIQQLPPGHMLQADSDGVRIDEYWKLQFRYDATRDHASTAAQLDALLDTAVAQHCRSDASLGCHLSGGLDSSTVAAFASVHRPALDTFSIRFDSGGPYDESAYARAVAQAIGSRHFEDQPVLGNTEQILAFLVYHVEQPITSSAVAYFGASQLAAQHVTVALTGHGGDEVFGGYAAQFAVAYGGGGPIASSGLPSAQVSARARLEFLLRSEGLSGVVRRLRGQPAVPLGDLADEEELWVRLHCSRPEAVQSPSMDAAFKAALGGYSSADDFLSTFREAPTSEVFDKALHHDLRTYLPSLLHVEDRTSMAMSIESRVPLLDHRIIEFAATVPPDVKVPGRVSKQLLRTVSAGRLPEMVRTRRDKGAFPVPINEWMQGPLYNFSRSLLTSKRALSRGVYASSWIKACVSTRQHLWPLVMFELWARLFLDGDRDLLEQVAEYRATLRVR